MYNLLNSRRNAKLYKAFFLFLLLITMLLTVYINYRRELYDYVQCLKCVKELNNIEYTVIIL